MVKSQGAISGRWVIRFDCRPLELSNRGRLHWHRTSESIIAIDDETACNFNLPTSAGGLVMRHPATKEGPCPRSERYGSQGLRQCGDLATART
jgi:hypothetical protein